MFHDLYRGKRVLVTGHTGFKGSWLCEWLHQMGAEVCGYSKDIPTQPSLFEAILLKDRVADHRGDIRDFATMAEVFRKFQPQIVFHLAAQPLVRWSYDHPLETFETNAIGTLKVLECIRATKSVRSAVIVTTDKVYENVGWEFGYRENDPLGGHDPYSASKACSEIVFSSYARSFLSGGERALGVASARAGNVIGGGDWAEDRIVPDCVRAWSKGREVVLRNPDAVRPWQHVLEPLAGYLRLGEVLWSHPERAHGMAFNFGPGGELNRTVMQLVMGMQKHWTGASHRVERKDSGKKEAHFLRLSVDRANEVLGWKPLLGFAETVEWTAEWYRQCLEEKGRALPGVRAQISSYGNLLQK